MNANHRPVTKKSYLYFFVEKVIIKKIKHKTDIPIA